MADKQTLPNSKDGGFWAGDKIRISKNSLENITCSEHDFKLDIKNRNAECKRCGYGFMFKVNEVKESPKYIEVNTKFLNKPIRISK